MKVKRTWETQEVSYATALARELIDYDSGIAESAQRTAESTASKLAELIDVMVSTGVLPSKQAIDLLGYGWEIV